MTETIRQFYRGIIEASPIATFVLGKDHRIVYWNRSLENLTGIPAAEIVGTNRQWRAFYDKERPVMADLILDGDLDRIEAYYAGKYRPSPLTGGYEALDFFPRFGDEGKWLFFTASPLLDEQGTMTGAMTTLQDITALKRTEAELRDREARYRLLTENATDIIWTADMKMRLTYISPSVERVLGYSPEEAQSLPVQALVTPESYQQAMKVMNDELDRMATVSQGRPTTLVVEMVRKDGATVWTEVNATWLRDEGGGVKGILGVSRDITERKTTEDLLRASEEKFRLLAENANDIIWIRDLHLNLVYINRAIERIRGFTPEEEMARSPEQSLTADSLERVRRMFSEAMARESSGKLLTEPYILEVEALCKDGSTKWMEMSMNWLRNRDGRAEGIIGISRDISERRQVELELRRAEQLADQANQAKSQFLANVSHEIRTPMNGVLGMVELLKSTGLNAEQMDYADTIYQSASSLLEIINDILDISKIESGKMNLHEEIFNLEECVDGIREILDYPARNKGLNLTVHYLAPRWVLGDKTRVRQILTNLTGNAVKFTDKGQVTIRVDYHQATACFRIAVSDTGIGIPEGMQKTVFESFRQVDGSVSRRYEGTGLGLSIAKNMAELMGGRIELESRVGQGSTFTVFLPLKASDDGTSEAKGTEAVNYVVEGLYVMVAEDNPASLKLMETMLKKRGCHVDTAGSGKEVLDKLRRRRYDLILMDVSMPAPDGFETTRIIRDPRSSVLDHDVHIVAMTAHALEGDRERCLQAGMNDYLSKPVNGDKLDQALAGIRS
ncbi:MAG: PAS domain S-box protein [Thermodesulfobacteriota bacterium]